MEDQSSTTTSSSDEEEKEDLFSSSSAAEENCAADDEYYDPLMHPGRHHCCDHLENADVHGATAGVYSQPQRSYPSGGDSTTHTFDWNHRGDQVQNPDSCAAEQTSSSSSRVFVIAQVLPSSAAAGAGCWDQDAGQFRHATRSCLATWEQTVQALMTAEQNSGFSSSSQNQNRVFAPPKTSGRKSGSVDNVENSSSEDTAGTNFPIRLDSTGFSELEREMNRGLADFLKAYLLDQEIAERAAATKETTTNTAGTTGRAAAPISSSKSEFSCSSFLETACGGVVRDVDRAGHKFRLPRIAFENSDRLKGPEVLIRKVLKHETSAASPTAGDGESAIASPAAISSVRKFLILYAEGHSVFSLPEKQVEALEPDHNYFSAGPGVKKTRRPRTTSSTSKTNATNVRLTQLRQKLVQFRALVTGEFDAEAFLRYCPQRVLRSSFPGLNMKRNESDEDHACREDRSNKNRSTSCSEDVDDEEKKNSAYLTKCLANWLPEQEEWDRCREKLAKSTDFDSLVTKLKELHDRELWESLKVVGGTGTSSSASTRGCSSWARGRHAEEQRDAEGSFGVKKNSPGGGSFFSKQALLMRRRACQAPLGVEKLQSLHRFLVDSEAVFLPFFSQRNKNLDDRCAGAASATRQETGGTSQVTSTKFQHITYHPHITTQIPQSVKDEYRYHLRSLVDFRSAEQKFCFVQCLLERRYETEAPRLLQEIGELQNEISAAGGEIDVDLENFDSTSRPKKAAAPTGKMNKNKTSPMTSFLKKTFQEEQKFVDYDFRTAERDDENEEGVEAQPLELLAAAGDPLSGVVYSKMSLVDFAKCAKAIYENAAYRPDVILLVGGDVVVDTAAAEESQVQDDMEQIANLSNLEVAVPLAAMAKGKVFYVGQVQGGGSVDISNWNYCNVTKEEQDHEKRMYF
ncbi:unnamed protein product [Amoebophrya sp. A120]|nr:unnamed protein product [Amoebophrya sp. A120]|eukprot:GSA120T00008582001.1